MERTVLNSSNLHSAGYNPATSELEIAFKKPKDGEVRSVWKYFNVPADKFNSLINAESAGKFFNSDIRGLYEAKKLS